MRGHDHGDHPRSRGVYTRRPACTSSATGSSPLARGLRDLMIPIMVDDRIIPARAGFTFAHRLAEIDVTGSSPLARGLLRTDVDIVVKARIIPARAGFTPRVVIVIGDLWDHPRSRGVYRTRSRRAWSRAGSSPLARGLQNFERAFPCLPRIIPARAGFTRRRAGAGRLS